MYIKNEQSQKQESTILCTIYIRLNKKHWTKILTITEKFTGHINNGETIHFYAN